MAVHKPQQNAALRALDAFASGYTRLVTAIAGVALVLAMVHVFADAILIKFFGKPIPGTFQIVASYYMVGLFFLPLAYAEKLDGHISADLIAGSLPEGVRRLLALLNRLLLIALLAMFTWWTTLKAMKETRIGEATVLNGLTIPLWPSRWLVPAGLLAFALVAIVRLFDGSREETAPETEAQIHD